MKILFKIIRKIVIAFGIIYFFNLVGSGLNFIIPINFITLLVVSFLEIPGLVVLIIIYLFII